MQNGAMKAWLDSSYLSGSNQSWIEQLYEDFLTDPDSVDANWRSMFQQLPGTGVKPDQFHSKTRDYFRRLAKDASRYTSSISDPDTNVKQVKVLQLINAYRFRGHQHANLDPLGLWKQERVADLDPAYHDLTEADFQESYNVGSFAIGKDTMKLGELIAALKQTYCGAIGAEYMHITSTEEKRWIQQRIESVAGKASFTADEKKRFLTELTAAEGLERYLGAKFPGAKRFSLEGGDALIPMLKEMIRHAGLSPSIPKNRPPSGRIRNGTENVPNAAIICTLGSASGKKTLPKAYATKPYTPKSNHSIALPSDAAVIAFFSLLSSMMVTSRSVMGFTFFLLSIIILFCSRLERTNLRRMTRSFASCVGSGELLCPTFQA